MFLLLICLLFHLVLLELLDRLSILENLEYLKILQKYCFFLTYASKVRNICKKDRYLSRSFKILNSYTSSASDRSSKREIRQFIIHNSPFLPTYLPPIRIGTSLEPHRNFIGTSPYIYRNITERIRAHRPIFISAYSTPFSHNPTTVRALLVCHLLVACVDVC